MLRPGDTVAGRFRVERIAGTGGMGTVARVLDASDGDRPIALKTMSASVASAVERFGREVAVLERLDHPHVIGYVDHGVLPSGEPWLAMEWVDGCTLDELLRAQGLTVSETVALARGIAAGLAAAHDAGIVHRDIKPANLLLPNRDPAAVKIADFGVARLDSLHKITRTGAAIGTPGYMAPEQAQGRREVGAASDVFSVGAVLFECITGRAAFPGEHVVAVLAKVLLEEQPQLHTLRPGVPDELDVLVGKLLAKDPADRPADGAALKRAIDALDLDAVTQGNERAADEHRIVTDSEQRLVSLVLVEQHAAALEETVSAQLEPTISAEHDVAPAKDPLFELADRNRARLERLLDGTALMIFAGQLAATDLAVRAGRAALEATETLVSTRVSVATGRAILGQKWPVGEAVETAAGLLFFEREHPTGRVRIDDLTAGLLASRFELDDSDQGRLLGAELKRATTSPALDSELPCVGRERELGLMGGVYAECAEEEAPRSILVVAPPGAGKTRLVAELERRLADEDGQWMLAQADTLRTRAPYTLLRDLVVRAIGDDVASFEGARTRLRATTEGLEEADAERIQIFLGELAFGHTDDEVPELLRSARRDPMLMSDQLRRALIDWLVFRARSEPLIIVLEDVHWADRISLDLFQQLIDRGDGSILIVATARPEIGDGVLHSAEGTRIDLGELGRKASERLLRAALSDPSDELVASVIDRAGGNPFVLEEMARSAARTGEAAVAPTALAMAQARLETLSSSQRRVLRAASVFGREFEPKSVAALVGNMSGLERALEELVDEAILRRAGAEGLRFRHDLLREAAYGSLPEDDRRAAHRGAGRWLESCEQPSPLLIAEHLRRGGDHARAATYYAAAGRSALDRCELAAASECARQGLELDPDATTRARLNLLRAEISVWRGEVDHAAEGAEIALGGLEPPSVEWLHAANILFQSAGRLGRFDRVAEVLAEVRSHRDTCKGSGQWLETAAAGTREIMRGGRHAEAREALAELEQQIELAPNIDAQLRGDIAFVRATALLHDGDVLGQLEVMADALRLYEQAENMRLTCSTLGELGFGYMQLGAFDRAQSILTRSLAEARELDLDHVAGWVLSLLVPLHTELGDIDRAVETAKEAIEAFQSQDDVRLAGATRAYLALALAERGELATAVGEALAAVTALEPFPPLHGFGLGVLGRLRILRGDLDGAIQATSLGIEIRDRLGSLEEGDTLLLEAHADALTKRGDPNAAAARAAARALLDNRANSITDPTLRRDFEQNIAANRRIRALDRSP